MHQADRIDHLATYAPSISFWYWTKQHRGRTANTKDAVFADPICDLPASPASRTLGERIAELLGLEAITGKSATREACLEALTTANIFHFQGHADFNRSDPLQSKLHLTGGHVTAQQVMNLARSGNDSPALITLGACESGATHMALGDEPLGLASAFLMSGSRAVCAPIWPVRDTDAAIFMEAFYTKLIGADEPCVATAYRAAVLTVRGTPGLEAPYHWAPYVLSGDRWLN
ncbi:MAG: CHAT domain-containing protein [Alphaproteobacteria bacterium]|nr:CHAT domain-containing protein [Alphaproteobacteria bacterium]